jgi:2-hydroxychromene-2-carboxylate isomerase
LTSDLRPVLRVFYGISSPWAYLGFRRMEAIARKHDAILELRPIRVIPENGGVLLRTRPDARQAYHAVELERWRAHLGIPLNLQPKYYPCRTIELAAKCIIALQQSGYDGAEVSFRIQRALWAEDKDIAELSLLQQIVTEVHNPDVARLVTDPYPESVTEAWHANLKEAEALGIFGTPTYVVGDELFWGQDRLDFVNRKLSALRATTTAAA